MAIRPVHLDPPLQEAIDRAREELTAAGQLQPKPGPYKSPLGEKERAAVARMLSDGTYRRLADAVVAEDPELADL